MRMLKNNVQLIGHVGMDPVLREIGTNKRIVKISVATTEYYRDSEGEKKTSTAWHQVVVWDKLADIVNRLCVKGSEVAISGRLTYRTYLDKEGVNRNITEIVATEVMVFNAQRQPAVA